MTGGFGLVSGGGCVSALSTTGSGDATIGSGVGACSGARGLGRGAGLGCDDDSSDACTSLSFTRSFLGK